ncbi:MAG: hypothetical protein V4754_21510 [Pseudomonadota bacterium]
MKNLLCWAACALFTPAATGAAMLSQEACASRFAASVPVERQVAQLQAPIEAAIATLDNAQLTLPSPTLASGNVTYLSIAPNFAERLDQVCVLGYFELVRNEHISRLPLMVESVEVAKTAHAHEPNLAIATTRIYFRVPGADDFGGADGRPALWRFWEGDQALRLKIAAFHQADGAGRVYFGREVRLVVSGKGHSVVAAVLFALCCYVLAATAVPVSAGRLPGARGRRARAAVARLGLARLLPWNIAGANGQASLSQLQMLVFTLIVATLLFYQWLRTGLLQEISTDLLYLIGISTAGTAATQVATSIRKDLDPAIYQYVQQLGWFTAPLAPAHGKASASGLLMSNKRFDIYKFQMLVFTFVIAAYVIASGANELGNIRISATLLALMGMSQGAYVGGRAAADVLTPLQDQLRGMHTLQQRCQASTDARVTEPLRRQFRQAAAQAGAMFGRMFGRDLPEFMLEMPCDVVIEPVSGDPAMPS